MIELLKKALTVLLEVLPWVRKWRRAKRLEEAEEAIAHGDREGLNRWWNEWRKRR